MFTDTLVPHRPLLAPPIFVLPPLCHADFSALTQTSLLAVITLVPVSKETGTKVYVDRVFMYHRIFLSLYLRIFVSLSPRIFVFIVSQHFGLASSLYSVAVVTVVIHKLDCYLTCSCLALLGLVIEGLCLTSIANSLYLQLLIT